MVNTLEQIRELLGIGLVPEQVSSAVGCSVSYISQLMSDDSFSQEVATLRATALQANTKRDRSIDGIEDTLIDRIKEAVDNRSFYKPHDLLRAFHVMNNAKRRGIASASNSVVHQTVVTLNIPTRVAQKFTISPQGEVLSVEDQTLVTMSTHTLLETLKKSGGSEGAKYAQAAKFLPLTAAAQLNNFNTQSDEES